MIEKASKSEKEAKVIQVTFDEIGEAIGCLSAMKDTLLKISTSTSFIDGAAKVIEGVEKAVDAMDEDMSTALDSMMLLYGIMRQNHFDKVSGIRIHDYDYIGIVSGSKMQKITDKNVPESDTKQGDS